MKKLKSKISNFTRAILTVCVLAILVSIFTLIFAYEENEIPDYVESEPVVFNTPAPDLFDESNGEVEVLSEHGDDNVLLHGLADNIIHINTEDEYELSEIYIEDSEIDFEHLEADLDNFEVDLEHLDIDLGHLIEVTDGHSCGEVCNHDVWQCPICDSEEDCECYLEYCMICTEPNEDCECEFEGIMPLIEESTHHFCSGRGTFLPAITNTVIGHPSWPNMRFQIQNRTAPGTGSCACAPTQWAWYNGWHDERRDDSIRPPSNLLERTGHTFSHWRFVGEGPQGSWAIFWCAVWTPAPSHVCNFNIPANCTTPRRCSCGATSGNALGHDHRARTCTLNNACTRCDHYTLGALGHIHNNATCVANGICGRSGCSHITQNTLGHLSPGTLNGNSLGSCTANGREGRRICNRGGCTHVTNAGTVISARGHSWANWAAPGTNSAQPTTTQPVGTNAGQQRRTCLHNATSQFHNCNEHSFRNVWNVTYNRTILHNGVNATFTRTGGGALTQIIGQGNNATAPTVTAGSFCCCGRRIWQGWANLGQNITGARTIIPSTPTIRRHPVTFELYNDGLEGNHNGGGSLVQSIEHTQSAELPYVEDPYGHSFTGWGNGNEHIGITESRTIVAQYAPDPFDVVFLNYDGEVLYRETVDFGTGAYAPEDPVKYGHTFIGWHYENVDDNYDNTQPPQPTSAFYNYDYDNDYENGEYPIEPPPYSYIVTVAQTLYVQALFTPDPYYVIFLNYDGTEHDRQKVYFNSAAKLPDNFPEKYGHSFIDWDLEEFYIVSESDLEVSPIFEPDPFDAFFFDWDKVELHHETVLFGFSAAPPEDPKRYGHTFDGWDSECFMISTAEDIEVYATYQINTYKVQFLDWNDTNLYEENVSHGSTATAPTVPKRIGYTFSGWSEDFSYIDADTTIYATYTPTPLAPKPEDDADDGEYINNSEDNTGNNNENGGENGVGSDSQDDDGGSSGGDNEGFNNNGAGLGLANSSTVLDLSQFELDQNQSGNFNTMFGQTGENEETYFFGDQNVPESGFVSDTAFSEEDNNSRRMAPLFSFMGRDIFFFADFHTDSWALMNLLLVILGMVLTVKNSVTAIRKKLNAGNGQVLLADELAEGDYDKRNKWFVMGAALSLVSIFLFILTQNLTALIAILDFWTIALMAIMLAQVVVYRIFSNNQSVTGIDEDVTEITDIIDDETDIV